MNASEYIQLIKSLKVETNTKYLPTKKQTFCNFFAQDLCKLSQTPLPTGACHDMLTKLPTTTGWVKVDYVTAQSKANSGIVSIAITKDHIVIIRPSNTTPTNIGKIKISQAGYKNFEDTTLSYAWSHDRFNEIQFYSWNV